MTRTTRALCLVGGTVSSGIGVVGIFVPLLPTTPFLLLAVFLYARSSERLHTRLLGNRWIGGYLRRYVERRSMTRRHKVLTLALLWMTLVLSAVFAVDAAWARALLGAVALGVTAHLVRLPTA